MLMGGEDEALTFSKYNSSQALWLSPTFLPSTSGCYFMKWKIISQKFYLERVSEMKNPRMSKLPPKEGALVVRKCKSMERRL